MSLTKDKIQEIAITLFNQKGFSSVSMKQIAEELGISPGNLSYHYKTKADLMEAIYHNMRQTASDYIYPGGYITLHHFEQMLQKFHSLMRQYRFFFNDVVHIVRLYPALGKAYLATNLVRFRESKRLIDYYVTTGRMVPETADIDYNKLIHTIWMVSAFWSSQSQVINTAAYPTNRVPMTAMLWQLMFPYLTEAGWAEYRQIRQYEGELGAQSPGQQNEDY